MTPIPQYHPEHFSMTGSEHAQMDMDRDRQATATIDAFGYPLSRTARDDGIYAYSSNVSTGDRIPVAYQEDEQGNITIHKYQERDPHIYSAVYAYADEIIKKNLERCKTPTQKAHLYLFAITNAIALKIRPDQKQAEGNNQKLLEEASTVTTEDIKAHEAEVCTTKSLIAFEFLKQSYPQITPELHLTVDPNNEEGHMYLMVHIAGETKEFHPNSPLAEKGPNGQIVYTPHLV